MTGTAMIIDGNNLFMRSVYAARDHNGRPRMLTSTGLWTGPLVLFVATLARYVRIESPDRLLVIWDGGTAPWRKERLPSYKAHRKPVPDDRKAEEDSAIDLVHHFCALAGIATTRMTNWEADDLIAGAWAGADPLSTDQIVILSSDKDFLQLVGPSPQGVDTELVRLSSAGTATDRWTEMRVVDELGYAPARWPLVTALAGDTGDGVPGLPGIGPKKAVALLRDADYDWQRLLLNLGPEKALVATDSRAVVDLRDPRLRIPTPPWRPTGHADVLWSDLIRFVSGHEMDKIKRDLEARTLWSARDLISVTESDPRENGGPA